MENEPETDASRQGVRGELLSRSDAQLITQAVRNRWPLSDEQKSQIVESLMLVMQTADADRDIVSAARALVAIEKQNQDEQKIHRPRAGANHLHLHVNGTIEEKRQHAAALLSQLGITVVK